MVYFQWISTVFISYIYMHIPIVSSWFDHLMLCLSETSRKRTSCSIMRLVPNLNLLSAVFPNHLVFIFSFQPPMPLHPHPIFRVQFTFFLLFFWCASLHGTFFYWMCWALNHSFLSASVLVCLLLCFFFFYSFHRMQSMRREDQGLLEGENSVMVGIGLCCISVMVPPLTHIAQACHMPRKTAPKPFFKAAWRVGYAMVSRGNAGWIVSKSRRPCLR